MIYPEAASTSVSDSTIAPLARFLSSFFSLFLSFFFLFAAPFSLAFAASFRERARAFWFTIPRRPRGSGTERRLERSRGEEMERNGGGGGGGGREKRPFVLLLSSQFRQSPRYSVEFTTHRDVSAARDPRLSSNLVFERVRVSPRPWINARNYGGGEKRSAIG